MKKNTKKANENVMLNKDFLKSFRRKDLLEAVEILSSMHEAHDYRAEAQSRACDEMIISALAASTSYKSVVEDVKEYIVNNDVRFKNYDRDTKKIVKRFINHVVNDTRERHEKRIADMIAEAITIKRSREQQQAQA
ncbi:MAG: hypothetical protein WC346_00315 [Methanogenium sp.]|jgi:hypothetical protein